MRLLLGALGLLPVRARSLLAGGVGRLAFALGIRRRLTLAQLGWAFPAWSPAERRAVARRTYARMARAAVDGLAPGGFEARAFQSALEAGDLAAFDRALAEGKGLLVASAHFGSWEWVGELIAGAGYRFNAVVRPLRGALNAELVATRVRAGMGLIPPRGALAATVAALRRNEVVAVLVDQAVGGKHALFVPFFGRPAAVTPLLSMAALRTRAPVVVALGANVGGVPRLRVQGPIGLPSTGHRGQDLWAHAAAVTEVIERSIRAEPDQWLWLHRRWKLAPPAEEALRLELLALAADDERVRALLAADARLFQGYAPAMEALHRRNAARLAELVDAHGWPGRTRAGEDGAGAAFSIVQHAIGEPALLRRCLPLLEAAAARGEVPPLQPAMLADRIRFLEGRPQLYGTTLDWDEEGHLGPGPLEAPGEVDARREALGLPPLAIHVQRVLSAEREPHDLAPVDPGQRRADFEAWARRAGWRM